MVPFVKLTTVVGNWWYSIGTGPPGRTEPDRLPPRAVQHPAAPGGEPVQERIKQMTIRTVRGSLAAVVVTVAALGLLVGGARTAQGGAPASPFKNVKVLKGQSPQQLRQTMVTMSQALGVRCGACHTGGFESDASKMKRVAREMLAMTARLNKDVRSVDGKVSCMMCHRGQREPREGMGGMRGGRGERGEREGGERGEREHD